MLQINEIDICCVTESWLTTAVPTETVDITGYVCHRMDGRQGGGVVCYVRQELPFSVINSVQDDSVESLWLLYRQPCMPRLVSHILFGIVYHPPDVTSYTTSNHIVENVDAVMRLHPYAGTVIAGDFNHMTDKPLRDLKMKQIVHSATRKSASQLH